jgi:hypothetical protein
MFIMQLESGGNFAGGYGSWNQCSGGVPAGFAFRTLSGTAGGHAGQQDTSYQLTAQFD